MSATPKPVGAAGWDGRKAPSDEMYLSHSTVPKVLHSDVLERWMLNRTAEVTVENLGTVAHLVQQGDADQARRFIVDARWRKRDGSNLSEAQRGTFLHEVLENWLHGQAAPPIPVGEENLIQPMIDQLVGWFQTHAPELIAAELVVYNDRCGTAGRGDLWCRFTRGPLVNRYGAEQVWHLDLKTAADPHTGRGNDKRPYADSVGLQLAGGRWAEHYATFEPRIKSGNNYGGRAYLLNEAERAALQPLDAIVGAPEHMRTGVIHLTPLWARTFEIETGVDVIERVRAVREAWLWKNFESTKTLHPFIEGQAS